MTRLLTGKTVFILMSLCVSAIVFVIALRLELLSSLDLRVFDAAIMFRERPATHDIVIVSLNRQHLSDYVAQPLFPLSRHIDLHRRLVERLDSADARLIIFDILFDHLETVPDTSVKKFSETLKACGRVILAGSIDETASGVESSDFRITQTKLLYPSKDMADAAAAVGLVDVPLDQDGLVRRSYLSREFQQKVYGSLATEAYRLTHSGVYPPRGEDAFYMDFSILKKRAPILACSNVIAQDGWQDNVRDKLVLIGMANDEEIDRYRTPSVGGSSSDYQELSGVEIQALAIQTLLNKNLIHDAPHHLVLIAGSLLLALQSFVISKVRFYVALAWSLLLAATITIGGVVAAAAMSLTLPVGEFTISLFISTGLMFMLDTGLQRIRAAKYEQSLKSLNRDLDIAAKIQKSLQPEQGITETACIQMHAHQLQYDKVGGDYFDIVDLDEHKVGVLIADVSGHGIQASIIMSNIQGQFRELAGKHGSPAILVHSLNQSLSKVSGDTSSFVTLFYCIVDCRRMMLTYANAGHCPPIVVSERRGVKMLQSGGTFIGPFATSGWNDYGCSLNPGDLICLYTDGVTEAHAKSKGEMFGEKRLAECLTEAKSLQLTEITSYIDKTGRMFMKGGQFEDDWTLLILRVKQLS